MGPGRQQYMHTITAGDPSSPPLVLLPGYGAGAGFYFRCAWAPMQLAPACNLGPAKIFSGAGSVLTGIFNNIVPVMPLGPAWQLWAPPSCSCHVIMRDECGCLIRNLDGLARHFRLHAVDLLGTGMSGARPARLHKPTKICAALISAQGSGRRRQPRRSADAVCTGPCPRSSSRGGYLVSMPFAMPHPSLRRCRGTELKVHFVGFGSSL